MLTRTNLRTFCAVFALILLISGFSACAEEVVDYIDSYTDNETGLIFYESESGYWGFMTAEGEKLLDPVLIYPGWECFEEGLLAAIKIDEKYGYLDRDGEIAIDAVYDRARDFEYGLALAILGDEQ